MHHAFWTSIEIQENNVAMYGHGLVFWLFVAVSYTYLLGGIAILLNAIYSYPNFYRQQFVIMIIASIFPFGGNIMYIFNLNPIPGIDWTPIFFTISGGLIAIGIIRFRMFDLAPMAHQQVLQKVADGIIVIDNQDRIIEVNSAFRDIIGIGKKKLIGQSIHDEIKDLPECIGYHDKEAYLEEFIKNDNGNQRVYDVHCNPLYDKKGALIGRIIVYRDITLRKRTEEALMLSNQKLENEIKEREKLIEELDAFARTVAHDLKNPLSAMTACSDILIDTLENDPESSLEFAELIKESGTTMEKIVNSLLLMARISHGQVKFHKFDMTGPVMGSLNRLRNMIDEKDAVVEYPPSWPEVKGYEPWIEEIWVNYISNALKYGGSPPVIKIGYDDSPGNAYTFWVKDNGKGIKPEDMNKLFTDFERLGKIGEGGHGLGLAIVKRIVEKLGGQVEVSSENIPGEGARFGFVLKAGENQE
jgi:PAS domain S-box-containing protein